ncbi:GntR family transcriptional regulator [Nitratireductor luteus]|uniref:GntR family transcriptional regulator n=1 Tax=Nitratireductor luteus TaxID=2976980 RepID=UPI0022406F51|nr:GntR family transcriptional regulator [Nitratireductor luteus]
MTDIPASDARARYERIYATLRKRICLLDYPPGRRLREEDLAEEFHTSRTPIRRVLARLEDEGLLWSVHGVGTIVTDIDIEELSQVYRLRIELAELIGKLMPVPPDQAMLNELFEMEARCAELASRLDAREFARLNMDFFQLILRLTANEPLRDISERLYFQTTRIWLKTASRFDHYRDMLRLEVESFQREMRDVMLAIESADLSAVGHVRRAHLTTSFSRLLAEARSDKKADIN